MTYMLKINCLNPLWNFFVLTFQDSSSTWSPKLALIRAQGLHCGLLWNACLQLHLVVLRSTAPSSAAGSRPALLLPGRDEGIKSVFVYHDRFLNFLRVEPFKGHILIDSLFFYFRTVPPVSMQSPAPKHLQVGTEHALHWSPLLTCTVLHSAPQSNTSN